MLLVETRLADIENSDTMVADARNRKRAWLVDRFPYLVATLISTGIAVFLFLNPQAAPRPAAPVVTHPAK